MEIPKDYKKSYATPELIAYGSILTLTQGSSDGSVLDQAFPQGTLKGDLTFS
jgi:hypothetical protein